MESMITKKVSAHRRSGSILAPYLFGLFQIVELGSDIWNRVCAISSEGKAS